MRREHAVLPIDRGVVGDTVLVEHGVHAAGLEVVDIAPVPHAEHAGEDAHRAAVVEERDDAQRVDARRVEPRHLGVLGQELLEQNLSAGEALGAEGLGVADLSARVDLDAVAAEAVGDLRDDPGVPLEERRELVGGARAKVEVLSTEVRGEALVEERFVGEQPPVLDGVEAAREMVRLRARHVGPALTARQRVEVPLRVVLEVDLVAHRRPQHVEHDDPPRLAAGSRRAARDARQVGGVERPCPAREVPQAGAPAERARHLGRGREAVRLVVPG